MATQRMSYLILLFGLLLTPFLFTGCEIFCDCEDEIEATYGHFGEPDERFAENTDEKFELTLRYIALGFEKVFAWGDRESRYCCLESTKSITEDEPEDPDDPEEPEEPEDPDGPEDPDDPDNPEVPDDPDDDGDENDEEEDDEENSAPLAFNQRVYPHADDAEKEIELEAVDPDGDSLDFEIRDQPKKGSLDKLISSSGIIIYTPDREYSDGETDEFTFVANDGQEDSNEATVSIIFGNQAPVAHDVEIELAATDDPDPSPITIQLNGSDANGDPLTYKVTNTDGITNGVLQEGDLDEELGTVPYQQGAGDYKDSFKYRVTDGEENSTTGTVTITVNDP